MDIPKSQQAVGVQKRSTAERERDITVELELWTRNHTYAAIATHVNECKDKADRSYTITAEQVGHDIRKWRKHWAEARVDDVNSLFLKIIAGLETNIRLAHDAYTKSLEPVTEVITEFEPNHKGDGKVDHVTKRTLKRTHRNPDIACIGEIRQNIVAMARITGIEMPRELRIGVAGDSFGFMDMLKLAEGVDQTELEAHADEI